MSKVCDKVLLVEANNLSNEQVEKLSGYIQTLPEVDGADLDTKVEWVIEILEGKVIYVFGREGKDLIGWESNYVQSVWPLEDLLKYIDEEGCSARIYIGGFESLRETIKLVKGAQATHSSFCTGAKEYEQIIVKDGVLDQVSRLIRDIEPISGDTEEMDDCQAQFLIKSDTAVAVIGGANVVDGLKEPFGVVCTYDEQPDKILLLEGLGFFKCIDGGFEIITGNLGTVIEEVAKAENELNAADTINRIRKLDKKINKEEAESLIKLASALCVSLYSGGEEDSLRVMDCSSEEEYFLTLEETKEWLNKRSHSVLRMADKIRGIIGE